MAASYYLAIDVGTSRTAAATSRLDADGGLQTASFPLGRSSDSVPTSMFVTNSDLLFGDAAERRGITEPERLVREFKRRIGDDVPLIVGDRRFRPEEIFALVVGWVVDTVSAREGRLPSAIAVTVPAAWGAFRKQLVQDALAHQGWSSVTLVAEPEAAARHYVTTTELAPKRALAVYDLGGGTFDAIVLRREANGDVQMVGAPIGLEDVGGADFDDALFRHAVAVGGITDDDLADSGDDRVALAGFRRECVEAKEALSFDSEAVVPLLIGTSRGTVRITRTEFEQMIEVQISRTADVLSETINASGVPLKDIDAILLTGGSSRVPRVSQLLSERFNRRIAIDADPKAIIALGAVRMLSDRAGVLVPATPSAAPATAEAAGAALALEQASAAQSVPEATDADAAAGTPKRLLGIFTKKNRGVQTAAFMAAGLVVLGVGLIIPTAATSKHDVSPAVSSSLQNALKGGSAQVAELPAASSSAAGQPPAAASPTNSGSSDNADNADNGWSILPVVSRSGRSSSAS